MKKILAIILVIAIAATLGACAKAPTHSHYALATKVIELDYEQDIVYCEDGNGNVWSFYGTEDWDIGDIASLCMNDMGTEQIYDDKIINARYSAF